MTLTNALFGEQWSIVIWAFVASAALYLLYLHRESVQVARRERQEGVSTSILTYIRFQFFYDWRRALATLTTLGGIALGALSYLPVPFIHFDPIGMAAALGVIGAGLNVAGIVSTPPVAFLLALVGVIVAAYLFVAYKKISQS